MLMMAKTSADSLLALLNDILDFSKIEAGKLDLETIDFSLRDSMENVLRVLSVQAHQKKLELSCHVLPDTPDRLRGDPTRLRQILMNLVGNAVKFTAKGEVAVRVECEEDGEESVLLGFAVRDTGIGIPAEQQATDFSGVHAGRWIDDADVWRKRTGAGDLFEAGGVDGRGDSRGEQAGSGEHIFIFAAIFAAEGSGCGSSKPSLDASMLRGMTVLIVDDNATNRSNFERAGAEMGDEADTL